MTTLDFVMIGITVMSVVAYFWLDYLGQSARKKALNAFGPINTPEEAGLKIQKALENRRTYVDVPKSTNFSN